MILSMRMRNIALIEELSLEFGEGLHVMTGETGAGKSIVVDAVNLVLGGRAARELIRTGTDKAWVEAVFDASGNVEAWLPAGKRGKFAPGEGVYFEMLTFVEGSTEAMVLSAKGTKTAMAWLASILPDYRKMRDDIRQNRGGKHVPPWWFWLAIRGALDAQKKPVYEKTLGNSYVTAPTWVHDDLSSRDT